MKVAPYQPRSRGIVFQSRSLPIGRESCEELFFGCDVSTLDAKSCAESFSPKKLSIKSRRVSHRIRFQAQIAQLRKKFESGKSGYKVPPCVAPHPNPDPNCIDEPSV